MLAEAGAPSVPGHASTARVQYLRCQSGEAVDDILVGFSDGGHDFVQAKRSLSLKVGENSELAKALDQCVRQVVGSRGDDKGGRPWDRPLDPARDRLVLAVGASSSKPIRDDLAAVLPRVPDLRPQQPLTDAALTTAQSNALAVVSDHVRRSWKAATGVDATDDDLRTLLSLLSVLEFDVDPGGANEREALLLLRSAVVHEPTHDAAAWHVVWSTTAQCAQDQSGLDRRGLEKAVRNAGIRMRGVRSYEQDVNRLKATSMQAMALVERFASFESGGAVIKLPRDVSDTIGTLAMHHSFAIVGEPGAGKSAALYEAAAALAPNTAVVVLQALDVACRNLAELRQQLGLEHHLVEVLDNWRDADVGVLFIDALDAARDEASARTLRDLMDLVLKKASRWRVVASIRSFDLKQGTHYQHVFHGSLADVPAEFQRSEFAQGRHVFVPRLSDQELAELATLAPLLRPLIDSASGPLKDLLRVPFNVQLLAQLVDDGAELSALQPLRTQGELLDLYWLRRVRRDAHGDARESLLRRVCEQMVAARQLRVDRTSLSLGSTESSLLHDLLSAHVVMELDSPHARVLTFSHHVLFDYAAARLLLPVEPGDLATYLASEPSLVFVLRPSLVLAFHERWCHSREAFWATTLRLIADDRIEAVGEVIGPVTAVDLATSDEDWNPVFEALAGANPSMQAAAAKALQYVVGSLLAGSLRPTVGADAAPWAALAERIAASLRPDLTGALRVLLYQLTEKDGEMTPEERASAGRAARLLLQYAERELPNNRNLVNASIVFVARTIATAPSASTLLLRRSLEPDRVQQFGYHELPALAREVQHLMADPAFVADLYVATFSFTEKSKETTAIGRSAILPLSSNRAQDYEGAYYALAEAFPAFFEASPVHATGALVRAIDAFIQEEHPPASGIIEEETFTVGEAPVRLRTDYSEIWDKTPHDDAQRLLIAFEEGLLALADAGAAQTLRDVLMVVVGSNRMAAVWRRLLRAGAQRPGTLGVLLAPLLQRPVFDAYDTSRAAVRLAQAVYPHLAAPEREKLDEVLLSLSDTADKGRPARERLRDECVGGLPQELLQKQELRDLAGRLAATRDRAGDAAARHPSAAADDVDKDDEDDDDEDFTMSTGWLDPDDAMLQLEGVNVADEASAYLRSLVAPVQAFANKHTNTEPELGEVEQILPEITHLEEAAIDGEWRRIHVRVLKLARVVVAEAYSVIPKCRALPPDHAALQRARQGLLQAATSASPEVDDKIEANWDMKGSGWGPADRIEAGQGLLYLARRKETCDSEVLDALETLAADPVAAVRYQIAANLNLLYYTARDRMWSILERRIAEEQRGGLANALLASLRRLIPADEERVAGLAIQLATRFAAHKEVARSSTKLLTAMWIWRKTAGARAHVDRAIANVSTAPEVAGAVFHVIRKPLAHGALGDPEVEDVRERTFEVTKQLLANALESYRTGIEGQDFSVRGEAEVENARAIVGIIDGVARELYFASGAHDRSERRPADEPKQRRFYTEAGGVIDLLITTGLPPATHSLVKMFESMIDLQPAEIFFRIRDLIRAGHAAGYSQEGLAIDLVVRIVERYLADYRHLFQASAELRAALSEILNLFIAAGWPQALRLASRLEDIFR